MYISTLLLVTMDFIMFVICFVSMSRHSYSCHCMDGLCAVLFSASDAASVMPSGPVGFFQFETDE